MFCGNADAVLAWNTTRLFEVSVNFPHPAPEQAYLSFQDAGGAGGELPHLHSACFGHQLSIICLVLEANLLTVGLKHTRRRISPGRFVRSDLLWQLGVWEVGHTVFIRLTTQCVRRARRNNIWIIPSAPAAKELYSERRHGVGGKLHLQIQIRAKRCTWWVRSSTFIIPEKTLAWKHFSPEENMIISTTHMFWHNHCCIYCKKIRDFMTRYDIKSTKSTEN